jgi:hypothetical protein
MGWIDVAIPGLIGLTLVASPGLFMKPTGDKEKDANTTSKLRIIGAVLLAVAAGYLLIKLAMAR